MEFIFFFNLFCSTLFCSILSCSILFCSILFYSILFHSIVSCPVLLHSLPLYPILFSLWFAVLSFSVRITSNSLHALFQPRNIPGSDLHFLLNNCNLRIDWMEVSSRKENILALHETHNMRITVMLILCHRLYDDCVKILEALVWGLLTYFEARTIVRYTYNRKHFKKWNG